MTQKYGDEQLREMARQETKRLLDLIEQNGIDPYELTFAAEYLGQAAIGTQWAEPALATLERLANHSHSVVREGAVYGLCQYIGEPQEKQAMQVLRDRLTVETSECLAEMIEETLREG